MIFRQIRSTDGTGTLSYLIADQHTRQAVVIDPNVEDTRRILLLAEELGGRITHVIDTHTHADHISAAGELKRRIGAQLIMHEKTMDKWAIVDQGDAFGIGDILRANAAHTVDLFVNHEDVVSVDSLRFRILHTPGHTDNHISVLLGDRLFTGDLLLIGQAGRSDLPGGNPDEQYDSLFTHILTLPDSTRIYPGHDYQDREFAFLGDEKITNPFLRPRTKDEYRAFLTDFFPPFAESISGGKTILQCGTKRVSFTQKNFQDITAAQLASMLQDEPAVYVLDVREPFELIAFGAIPGAKNIPVSRITERLDELPSDRSQTIAVVCQSGNRSYEVAHFLAKNGFTNVCNLNGGTSSWMTSGNRVVRGLQPAGQKR